jgi:hypothetical protein
VSTAAGDDRCDASDPLGGQGADQLGALALQIPRHHPHGADSTGRHDEETLRRWFERVGRVLPNLHLEINDVWVKGWPWPTTVFVQWDGAATLLDGGPYFNRGLHVSTLRLGKVKRSGWSRIHRKWLVGLPSKRRPEWKSRRPPNRQLGQSEPIRETSPCPLTQSTSPGSSCSPCRPSPSEVPPS